MRLIAAVFSVFLGVVSLGRVSAQDAAGGRVAPPREAAQRLVEIEQHMEQLRGEASTKRLGPAIGGMLLGYGAGTVLLLIGLEGLLVSDDGGNPMLRDETLRTRRIGGALFALGAGSVGLGIFGNRRLGQRLRERRLINGQLGELDEERRSLRSRMQFGVDPLSSRIDVRLTF
jgi:hypothetical protein